MQTVLSEGHAETLFDVPRAYRDHALGLLRIASGMSCQHPGFYQTKPWSLSAVQGVRSRQSFTVQ